MKRIVSLCLVSVLAFSAFADAKGDEIAHKFYDQKTPKDMISTASMVITDRSGITKARKLKMVMKDTAEGKKSYAEFIEPADVNGTKFLTVSKRGMETDQRLYLPAMKKVRKISSSSKDGEFVGSDLFYFDMEERFFEDATYTFLGENETLAGSAYAGMKFWKIAMTFTSPNAPYSKAIMWINMNDLAMYRSEAYDKKDGTLLKTIELNETKNIKGYTIGVKTTVSNIKKGSHTIMTLSNLDADIGVKDGDVSVKRLEQ
jgi:hypothetical protein